MVGMEPRTAIKDMFFYRYYFYVMYLAAVSVVVEALRYKPEGRGFDSGSFHCNFSMT
jgi:hypothetical protein